MTPDVEEKQVRQMLALAICDDNSLHTGGYKGYLFWAPSDDKVIIDGEFTADQLEAIAWWMRQKTSKETKS